ncbi:MAG: hypothetical protein IKS51_04110 [Erysipelotrichaceae bacterium]|nr:hypothetical protein [Erysipelotrichaceae bacterium]
MDYSEMKERVDELKKALYAMIAKISGIASDGNAEIESVKQKAVEILSDVLVRVDSQDLLRVDPDSFDKELDKVSQKAVELYQSVQGRINAIKGIAPVKEEPHQQAVVPDAMNETVQDEISAKAAAVILSWLKKEETL